MDVTSKTTRLSKIAREFNVGLTTIVEFLHKKGFNIAVDPNAKVPEECYDILQREYNSDISVKRESEKLSRRKKAEHHDSVTLDDVKPDEKEIEETEKILLIKDNGSKSVKTSQPAKTEPLKTEKKDNELKILGRINLETGKPIKEIAEIEKIETNVVSTIKEEPVKEVHSKEAATEVIPIEKKEPVIEVQKEISVVETKEVVKEKIQPIEQSHVSVDLHVDPQIESKTESKTESKIEQQIDPKIEVKIEPKIEKMPDHILPINSTPEKEPIIVKEEKTQPVVEVIQEKKRVIPRPQNIDNRTNDSGKFRNERNRQFDKPVETQGVKKHEERPPQKREPVNEIRKEREPWRNKFIPENKPPLHQTKTVGEKDGIEKTGDLAPQDAEIKAKPKEEEIYKTKVDRLTGPTVVGRIELPIEGDKKKAAATTTVPPEKKKRRKKRKRIKVNLPQDENKPQDRKPVDAKPGDKTNKPPVDKKKIITPIKKKVKKQIKKEVDEEDVQKQIKETLARLTSNKHKSKAAAKHRRTKRKEISERFEEQERQKELEQKILKVTEFVTVNELANMMDIAATELISTCFMSLGLSVTINMRLDAESITLVAGEYGYDIEFVSVDIKDLVPVENDDPADLKPRPPIVTVMGHVDHGKTSLLDYIRKSNVIAGEAGGITQHIGAYNVTLPDSRKITFLDTPGHEAFTAMRARGAQITDVAIIVVAADDSVMPQTIEAINHAKAAGVPIVFAVNKIDKPNANPMKIKGELANLHYVIEELGGKYQSEDISAKFGNNMDNLLEKVLIEAEMLELKANPDRRARGVVIESKLDKGRGYIATILVQTGTVHIGDYMLAGSQTGRIKAMYNERDTRVTFAGPSEPVQVLGLGGAPTAGDNFYIFSHEREARELANKISQLQREQGMRAQKHITLDEIGRRIAIGTFKELNLIIKGDVDGSVEALSNAVSKLSTDEIQVNIIHTGVGQIAENDVMLAAASNAIIVGFQVRPALAARRLAEKEGIDIRLYSIIYDAINQLKDAMEGMLSPLIKEEIIGTAEVRDVFKISKVGTIAGCLMRDGKINRKAKVRLIREGIVVYTGDISSLKRYKDDAKEVTSGMECGIGIDHFTDIKTGDMVEAFNVTEVDRTL